VEPQHHRARILGAEAVTHEAGPEPPRRPKLRHLLEEIVVRVEEEGQLGREVIYPKSRLERSIHVRDAVAEGEGHLLYRGAARFTNVIAGDGDRVPAGHVLPTERERIGDQTHRGFGRKDVGPARDVLLQDVVLYGAR